MTASDGKAVIQLTTAIAIMTTQCTSEFGQLAIPGRIANGGYAAKVDIPGHKSVFPGIVNGICKLIGKRQFCRTKLHLSG